MKESIKVAIAGATGYTGLQLTKILLKHPKVKISYLCAQKFIGKSISSPNILVFVFLVPMSIKKLGFIESS